jgi:hypothetical protein
MPIIAARKEDESPGRRARRWDPLRAASRQQRKTGGDPVADQSRYSDPGDGGGGLPRWVQLAGIVAAVIILLLIVMMLAGGLGGHTPPVTH